MLQSVAVSQQFLLLQYCRSEDRGVAINGAIALLGLVLKWVQALVLIYGFHQYFAPSPPFAVEVLALLGFPCVDPSDYLFVPDLRAVTLVTPVKSVTLKLSFFCFLLG